MTAAKPDHEFVPCPCDECDNRRCKVCLLPRSAHATPPRSAQPEPMVIFCPECKAQHIDLGEWATKPHRKHLCHSCGHVWKPHDHATVGVPIPAPPRSELADQLEALWKAATPGPWESDGKMVRARKASGRMGLLAYLSSFNSDNPSTFASARLIVALVNALPEILTALRRSR